MGFLKSTLRYFLYPVARPMEQARDSVKELRQDWQHGKEQREKRRAQVDGHNQEMNLEGLSERMAAAMKLPLRDIKNPRMRFEVLYKRNNWNPKELEEQWVAFRLTKLAAWIVGALLMVPCLISVAYVPAWAMLPMLGVVFMLCCLCVFVALKNALMQSQLELRSLHTWSDYVSRKDFFRHLLRG